MVVKVTAALERLPAAACLFALVSCSATQSDVNRQPPLSPIAITTPSGEYTLDPAHSSVVIRTKHFGLSYYTLRFTTLSAKLQFDAEAPTRSVLKATVAANSVRTEFPGGPAMDSRIQSAEWLNAADYPSIALASTGIALAGTNTGRMTGNLTLHGVTRPVTFDITFNGSFARHPFGRNYALLGFSGRGIINRSEFGMTEFLATAVEPGVGDEVEIIIEAEFMRPVASP